jgi:hypothetical protein
MSHFSEAYPNGIFEFNIAHSIEGERVLITAHCQRNLEGG